MKSHYITYWKTAPISMMTYWVHKLLETGGLDRVTKFEPPRQLQQLLPSPFGRLNLSP